MERKEAGGSIRSKNPGVFGGGGLSLFPYIKLRVSY